MSRRSMTLEDGLRQSNWRLARGLPGAVERLQRAAETREGTGEELCMLFVALLRSHGMLVRSVRWVRHQGIVWVFGIDWWP